MALARVSLAKTAVADEIVAEVSRQSGIPERHLRAEIPKAHRSERSIHTRSGIVVTLERRPTVDRAWVVCAMSDETMTDMEVVEGGEDREKVLASMVKKHGGAK